MRKIFLVVFALLFVGTALAEVCPACKFKCAPGVTNCWSCGKGLKTADPKLKKYAVKPIVLKIFASQTAKVGSSAAAEKQYTALSRWIDANPKKHDEAIAKLNALVDKTRGSVVEPLILKRIASIKKLKSAANKPMTEEERKNYVAREVARILNAIRENPNDTAAHVLALENLSAKAKGTRYENFIKMKLAEQQRKIEKK